MPLLEVRRTWWRGLAVGVFAGLVLSGCTGATAADDAKARLQVVTTVAPITSIVANIGGDRVAISGTVPEGTNSHTFEPPPSSARVLSDADIVFVNGLKLEDPTAELAEQNIRDDAEIVALGNRVLAKKDYIFDFSFPRAEGKPNPHLWTDPTYVEKYAQVVRNTLVKRDPKSKAYYDHNLAAYRHKVRALSAALRADQASVERRELLTYHDAYAYFARTYGWTVIGAVQPKDFEDPTPKEIVRLIEQIRAGRVPVVFGSEVFPSKVLEQIGRETGARYEATLRDDDLPGEPGDQEHSLLGLLRYDFVTMIEALGGSAEALKQVDVSDAAPDTADYPQ
jgi:ABC-type Zn uptake system ZnuABC Zn-binding protein ZnuA